MLTLSNGFLSARKSQLVCMTKLFIKNVYFKNCYQYRYLFLIWIRSFRTEIFWSCVIIYTLEYFPTSPNYHLLLLSSGVYQWIGCTQLTVNGRRRDQKGNGGDNPRVKRTHASRPRCLRERFDQEGTKRAREKRERARETGISPPVARTLVSVEPPCRLTRQSTIAHWPCEIVGAVIPRPIGLQPIFSPPHPTGAVQRRQKSRRCPTGSPQMCDPCYEKFLWEF